MRFSIFTLLATGVSSAMASSVQLESRDVIGIMETYTDYECKQGRKSIDMTGMEADMQGGYPNLDMGVKAVRIGVPNECVVVIWFESAATSPHQIIPSGFNYQCIPVESNGADIIWTISCT